MATWPAACDDTLASADTLDADGDGVTTCGADLIPGTPDDDCDDLDPAAAPGNSDAACDGYDSDCVPDPLELDDDGDGWLPCQGDCDDADPVLTPGDADGDGVTSCDGDCDDAQPLTLPGAPEQCDLEDNDCDGQVDEGIQIDNDGDGWLACQGDCDDWNHRTYPGAPERCDGVDNDCDGLVPAWEVDGDGDGWMICGGDCDDADPERSPDAAELLDGLDNDCDGAIDDGAVTCDAVVTPGASIQAAIDASAAGDVVCVAPGTYVGTLSFGGRDLHLLGTAGPLLTVLDGAGAGPMVALDNAEGPGAILEGFTVTNGVAQYGGGIFVEYADPTLQRLVLEGNSANNGGGLALRASFASVSRVAAVGNSAWRGGGVAVWEGRQPNLDTLLLQGNTTSNVGGGMFAQGSLTLDGAVVSGNTGTGGGGIWLNGGTHALSHILVVDNEATSGSGAGIAVALSNTAMANVIVSRNLGPFGAGLNVGDNSTVTLNNASFVGNLAPGSAGLRFNFTTTVLTGVVVSGNDTGGVQSGAAANLTFVSCDAWGNQGGDYLSLTSPTGQAGNLSVDPSFVAAAYPDPLDWDLHLAVGSPLIDAGAPNALDPDGSPADMGPYGGPGADAWDLDGDGFPAWWQPGPYDSATYPALGLDCDDLDPQVHPLSGC